MPTLHPRLYVFINYSHDASAETYLARAPGARPAGLPPGTRYKVFTVLHMPGSVEENVIGDSVSGAATTAEAILEQTRAAGNASSIALEQYIRELSLHSSYYAVKDGLIPEYLWKGGIIDPIVAGFVDGIWETIESGWGVANFLAAWQPNNLSAEAWQIRLQTWQFVKFLNGLATSPQLRTQTWNVLKESFGAYLGETLTLSNQGLYNQGKLIFEIVSMFIGIGEVKAILKGQSVTMGILTLLKAVPKNLSKFAVKAKQLGLSFAKSAYGFWIKDKGVVIGSIADGAIQPKVFLESGEEVLNEAGHTLARNSEGKIGFVDKAQGEIVQLIGKYDWNLVRKYFQYIQEVTGRPIVQNQIDNFKTALRIKEYKKLSKADYITHQKAYSSSRKEKMIKEWEENTKQKWPVDDKGERYQLHHIIEQQYGGPHEWWNAHPARFPDQHQGGIHGVGSPARELFK